VVGAPVTGNDPGGAKGFADDPCSSPSPAVPLVLMSGASQAVAATKTGDSLWRTRGRGVMDFSPSGSEAIIGGISDYGDI